MRLEYCKTTLLSDSMSGDFITQPNGMVSSRGHGIMHRLSPISLNAQGIFGSGA